MTLQETKKKVIAFSLWGNDPRYLGGALQNVSLAKIFYPDWVCRFYIGQSTLVNKKFVSQLKTNPNVEVVEMEEDGNWTGMFWRFYAALDLTVEVMLSRDADSRLGLREAEAVKDWLQGDKSFHIMRDNPQHGVPILGGMWGTKVAEFRELVGDGMLAHKAGNYWQCDQEYLRHNVYPRVKDVACVHDEFFEKKAFPTGAGKRSSEHFVGQAYNGVGFILDVPNYGVVSYQDYLAKNNVEWSPT
jgi:hypothetical protein